MMRAALMLFLLLVLFCASSNAQPPPPPPPSMADTFQGSGEVEFHGTERTDFGEFVLSRDQMKEMGYEREEYKERGPGEITETILRYDMNLTYYIRGDKAHPHCLKEDRTFNGMAKFWGWLSSSTYEGTVTVREVMYDIWGNNVGGVRLEFGKPQTNSSILYFYRRKTAESSVFYSFMKYQATPDSSLFVVPPECKD